MITTTHRREFISQIACVLCAGALGSVVSSCDTIDDGEPVVDINKYSDLKKIGGAIKKRYSRLNNGEPILIIRESENNFVVYSALCTHKGVEVKLPKNGEIVCPNHGSRFRVNDGSVIEGKAIELLVSFPTAFDDTTNLLRIG